MTTQSRPLPLWALILFAVAAAAVVLLVANLYNPAHEAVHRRARPPYHWLAEMGAALAA